MNFGRLCGRRLFNRSAFSRLASHASPGFLASVEVAAASKGGYPDIQAFQQTALTAQKPQVFRKQHASPTVQLPAMRKWFQAGSSSLQRESSLKHHFSESFIKEAQDWPFPYELIRLSPGDEAAITAFRDFLSGSTDMTDQIMAGILQSALAEGEGDSFFSIYAPMRLLLRAADFNASAEVAQENPLKLYIAQSQLTDLPQSLQDDLPAPEIVRRAGKGDMYSSSIWIGTEPTFTPLHRDPNPNLFCQLCSRKVLRLLPPKTGDRVFFEVQVLIRQQGNSRIRTSEMMQGPERQALHDAVWGSESESLSGDVHEVELAPGDALFIPEGWWHSVKSVESSGKLNGSVNWWFR